MISNGGMTRAVTSSHDPASRTTSQDVSVEPLRYGPFSPLTTASGVGSKSWEMVAPVVRMGPSLWRFAPYARPNPAPPPAKPAPRLNPHSRGDPRGSVQSIVSEVPTRPFVRASCCRRHFGYNPLHYRIPPPGRSQAGNWMHADDRLPGSRRWCSIEKDALTMRHLEATWI
jgi:hypothetical protein